MEDINEKYDQMIADYLKGRMNQEEKDSFKEEIKNNEILKDRVKASIYLINGLEKAGNDQDKKIIESVRKQEVTYSFSLFKIAASIILVLGIGVSGFNYHKGAKIIALGDKYYTEYDNQNFRGDVDELSKDLKDISEDIKKGNNIEVHISTLKSLYEDATRDDSKNMDAVMQKSSIFRLLVVAQLKNKDKESAIETIQHMLINDPESTDAEWAKRIKNDIESL